MKKRPSSLGDWGYGSLFRQREKKNAFLVTNPCHPMIFFRTRCTGLYLLCIWDRPLLYTLTSMYAAQKVEKTGGRYEISSVILVTLLQVTNGFGS